MHIIAEQIAIPRPAHQNAFPIILSLELSVLAMVLSASGACNDFAMAYIERLAKCLAVKSQHIAHTIIPVESKKYLILRISGFVFERKA